MLTPPIPEQIGRYRIMSLLGSGAMGDVYLAVDPHIDRQLAIKTVRVMGGTPADIEDRKQRLLREAKAAGKMMHPHVVTLFDADETEGVLYLAFEYVPGMDLSQRVGADPPLTLRQVLTLINQVASALDYAHTQRIVHRDIKPSNILIGPSGEAKVADFGIAKVLGLTEMTRTGSVVGSPQYMSPEQVRGEALDGRSDVFSLGVVLYELLCRARPFGGDTLSTLIFEILSKEPLSVELLRPGLPDRLPGLVGRMLAKDPAERIPSARAVAEEVSDLLQSLHPSQLDATALQAGAVVSRSVVSRSAGSGPVVSGPVVSGPVVSGPVVSGPAADISGRTPTATMENAPTIQSGSLPPALPPLPPVPGSAASPMPSPVPVSAPAPASHPEPSPAPISAFAPAPMSAPAPGSQAQGLPDQGLPDTRDLNRPSPLETGTYAGPRRGKTLLWVSLLLVAALALGFFASHLIPNDPADASDLVSDQASERVADGSTSTQGSGGESERSPSAATLGDSESSPGSSSASSSPPSDAETSRAETSTAETSRPVTSIAGPPQTVAPQAATRPPASAPQIPVTMPLPPASTSSPASKGETMQPGSPTGQTSAAPTVKPQPPIPAPARETPVQDSEATDRATAFDIAARSANRELQTGIRFFFDVKPKDTIVKIQARGERSIVQGRVEGFEPGRDARAMELPESGDYLITLVHPNYPDLVVLAHANANAGAPHTVRLDMARASKRRTGGPQAIRVSRGVAFIGKPVGATVLLDGKKLGAASDWPGARLPRSKKNLGLKRGRHTLRLEAEGYEPLEITVEVAPSADRRIHRIDFQLRRKR